jgi:hypothetical protein
MTGPRISLLSKRDVNMILCGLMLLDDALAPDSTGATLDDCHAELDKGVTVGEIDQLISRVSADDSMAACLPCRVNNHDGCADSWVSGVNLIHCDCDEGSCGVTIGADG